MHCLSSLEVRIILLLKFCIEWLWFLLRIPGVAGWNLYPETCYLHLGSSWLFSATLHIYRHYDSDWAAASSFQILYNLSFTAPIIMWGKLSLYRPSRPLGFREVEVLTFSDIRLTDGGKAVSPTRRPLSIPRKAPSTHFCFRLNRSQVRGAAGRIR
jgi:hypothetical protein